MSYLSVCLDLPRVGTLLKRPQFQVALVVKNMPANVADLRNAGLIRGSGNPLEEGMAMHFSILAWRIPWTEEPSRLQSVGS